MSLFAVSGLYSGYGANEIIHGIDFAAEAGEVVTILGPNGCGKSTFVRSVLGYVRARAGSIVFDGEDITALPPAKRIRRGIGYVPQITNVFRPMTVEENLEMGGYALTPGGRGQALRRVFDLFPILRERRAQAAGTLSGGERQMLALARAMMASPRLVFLDEPSAGLSPARADAVFTTIGMVAGLGTAVVIVEQDASRALAISMRGYVFVTGRVAFSATASEIVTGDRIRIAYLGGRQGDGRGRAP